MKVAILGCGYVGLELGRQLTGEHDVVGVRRSDEGITTIEDAGFTPIRADVTDPGDLEEVPESDVVVFAASSGDRDVESASRIFVDGQRTVLGWLESWDQPPDRYVYTSSTGVYGDHNGEWVDERTEPNPATEKASILQTAEDVVMSGARKRGIDPTVARLAGIYGPGRYRIDSFLEGKVRAGYRNVVHRDDAAGAIAFLLTEDLARDEVVLVVDDEPMDRWEFARWLANECNRPTPEGGSNGERFEDDAENEDWGEDGDGKGGEDGDGKGGEGGGERAKRRHRSDKRCSNDRLRELGYTFQYPNARDGYAEAIARWHRD